MNNRDQLQKQALDNWIANGGVGTVVAVTGFGKTRVGCLAIKHIQLSVKNPKILILTPTIALRDTVWPEELIKADIDPESIEFVCIQTAKNFNLDQDYDLIIADEIHMMTSTQNRMFFVNNCKKYKNILGLSATIDKPEIRLFLSNYAPIVFSFGIKEAIASQVVSDFEVYNILLELSPTERSQYNYHSIMFSKGINLVGGNLDNLYGSIKNPLTISRLAGANSLTEKEVKSMIMGAIHGLSKRIQIIHTSQSKINAILTLLSITKFKKVIIFTESIDFLETVTQTISGFNVHKLYYYHSKLKAKERAEQLEAFKNSESGILVAVKALNTGINIPECDTAIIASGTSAKIDFIQRMGRVLRKLEGKKASIYQFIIKDSQEEKWVEKRTEGLPKESIITINNLGELDS